MYHLTELALRQARHSVTALHHTDQVCDTRKAILAYFSFWVNSEFARGYYQACRTGIVWSTFEKRGCKVQTCTLHPLLSWRGILSEIMRGEWCSTIPVIFLRGRHMENALEIISYIREALGIVYTIIALVIALDAFLKCFFGYKVFKISLVVNGFIVGGIIGGLLGLIFTGEDFGAFLGFLLMGLVGAFFAKIAFYLAVFFDGFLWAFIIFFILIAVGGGNIPAALTGGFILGIITGLISCFIKKGLLIIKTAIQGATMLGAVITTYTNLGVGIIAGILFSILGIVVQTAFEKDDKKRKEQIVHNYDENTFNITENYEAKSQGQNPSLFIPEIENELKYVFSEDVIDQIRQLPQFINDTNWICSCGQATSENQCPRCGMMHDDAKEKMNYAYLKEHKRQREEILKERLEQEAEQERIVREERKKELSKKTKETLQRLTNVSLYILIGCDGLFALRYILVTIYIITDTLWLKLGYNITLAHLGNIGYSLAVNIKPLFVLITILFFLSIAYLIYTYVINRLKIEKIRLAFVIAAIGIGIMIITFVTVSITRNEYLIFY